MKKFITAILAILYITTSAGATVEMHYCMGKIADWSIGHNTAKTCGKCGMEKTDAKDNGCCKDEHRFYKDDSAQKLSESNLQQLKDFSIALPASYIELTHNEFPAATAVIPLSHAPPRTGTVDVYILNCTYLI